MNPRRAQKGAERVLSREPAVLAEPPGGDVIEMDELCVRFSPALWLWIAASRMTRLVLDFVIADRGDNALRRLLEEELHPGHSRRVSGLARLADQDRCLGGLSASAPPNCTRFVPNRAVRPASWKL